MGLFQKATKEQAKLRLSIDGVSGSGKTYTALALATRIVQRQGGRIAVVDTEHGSASKYADTFDFDVVNMEPPFDPRRFIKLMQDAAGEGYTVLVVDSLSHAWFGQGGLLDLVDEIAKVQAAKFKSAPNTFAAWKDGTLIQNSMADTIIRSPMHIIATLRAKADYVQNQDDKGRTKITKVGTAPIQKEGLEYEFDITLSMDLDNNAAVVKSRCPAITGKVYPKPGDKFMDVVLDWLNAGAARPPVVKAPTNGTNGTGKDATGTGYEEKLLDGVDELQDGQASPATVYYLDAVRATFGPDDETAASAWVIERYTKSKTPGNIRTKHAECSDDELVLLGDAVKKHAAFYVKEWQASRPALPPLPETQLPRPFAPETTSQPEVVGVLIVDGASASDEHITNALGAEQDGTAADNPFTEDEKKPAVKMHTCEYCGHARPETELKRSTIRRNRQDMTNWYCADKDCAAFAQMASEG